MPEAPRIFTTPKLKPTLRQPVVVLQRATHAVELLAVWERSVVRSGAAPAAPQTAVAGAVEVVVVVEVVVEVVVTRDVTVVGWKEVAVETDMLVCVVV